MDVKKLSVEDRVKLTMGADRWSNYDVDGKLYKLHVSDATVGMRTSVQSDDGTERILPAVAYPSAQIVANTWNPSLARKMGNAVANDCIERNVDVVLGPGLNIKRVPQNGRNFEYFSEDPYLTGVFGREYIRGVQEKHVGTCMKHYCCNNQEFSRWWVSVEVDERTLREIYLEAFRIACEAKPWSVMCSYNLVNGRRMSENGKLYTVLRKEFGFDGIVVSDWDAVKNQQASIEQGLALTMPYCEELQNATLRAAANGSLDEAALNDCAQQVADFVDKCQAEAKLRKIDMSLDERRGVALDIAREGMVLLKNDCALPLKSGASCFVTGAPSFRYYYGGGSSEVTAEAPFVPLDIELNACGVKATWAESIWEIAADKANVGHIEEALKAAALADVTVLAVGNPSSTELEGFDRQGIKLTNEEEQIIHDFARVSNLLVVAVYAGSAVDMSEWIDDVDAVVWAGYGGQHGNRALAEILTGKVNPSGRLTETFPLHLDDVPANESYADGTVIAYEEHLNVGYRYFDTFGKAVLFPFGFGLSYSRFYRDNLTVAPNDKGGYDVSFDVTNTSDVDGYDVPQVYVGELVSCVYRPSKELKGFAKVFVTAGETEHVTISLDRHAFEYYSVADDKWLVNDTVFEIYVGDNASNDDLSVRVTLK